MLHDPRDGRPIGCFILCPRSELAIEEDVAAHPKHPISRTMTIVERRGRRQADCGASVADEQRRHRHVKAIELVRFEEHRDGDAAPFDEHARAAAPAQQPHQHRGIDPIGGAFQPDDGRAAEAILARTDECPRADIQRFG